jgi:hypothetical protein
MATTFEALQSGIPLLPDSSPEEQLAVQRLSQRTVSKAIAAVAVTSAAATAAAAKATTTTATATTWVDLPTTNGWNAARKLQLAVDGKTIRLRGQASGPGDTTIVTLPQPMRPTTDMVFPLTLATGMGRIYISADTGAISASTTTVFLDGVSFLI